MKKIILIPSVVVFLLLGVVFYILFTPSGSNNVLKPIVNKKLKQNLKNVNIEVKKLDSKFKYIDVDAVIEESIKLNAKGKLDYFKKSFDLNYYTLANKVKIENIVYPLNLNIKGKIDGNINSFLVDGYGKGFNSNIGYRVKIEDTKAKSIKVNINNAELSQFFLLSKLEPMINGLAFINIKMPSLDIKNPNGTAHIEIKKGAFNSNLISKKYKINLPKDEAFETKLDAQVADKKIVGKGSLDTTTVKLNIKKVVSTLDFKIAKAYIDAKIDNLSRLEGLIDKKLRGTLFLDGIIYSNLKKDIMQASIKTKSFGGVSKVFYSNNSVKAKFEDISIEKIEKMLVEPYYITKGVLSGVVKIPDLDNLNGSFTLKSRGVINKKLLKVKLPSYKYNLDTLIGRLVKGKVLLKKANLNISYINLLLSGTQYNLLTKALTTKFKIKIESLSKLKSLTKQRLKGKLLIDGRLSKLGSSIDLQATTKSLGGVVNLSYTNGLVNAKLKNVSVHKLLYMLNQPTLLHKGFINATVKLKSINKLNGFASIVTNGLVDTKVVKKLYQIDLGSNFKYQLKSDNIVINKKKIKSKKIKINSNLFYLELINPLYKLNRGNFKSKYSLNIENLLDIKPIIKQKLVGSLKLKGIIEKDGSNFLISGISSKFGGNINFRLKNSKLNLQGAGINVLEVLDMLSKPRVLDGISTISLKYNLKSKKGDFKVKISQAKFLNSSLVDNLKKYANFDLSKELFNEAKLDGIINKSKIIFNLKAKGKRVEMIIHQGEINSKKETIKAKIKVKYKGKDYIFKVKGPLNDPSIKLSFSGAVKEKVLEKVKDKLKESGLADEIEKLIPKELKNKEVQQKAKELFKNLF